MIGQSKVRILEVYVNKWTDKATQEEKSRPKIIAFDQDAFLKTYEINLDPDYVKKLGIDKIKSIVNKPALYTIDYNLSFSKTGMFMTVFNISQI